MSAADPVRGRSSADLLGARDVTSLAVASTLRRFKLPYRTEAERGVIVLEPVNLLK